MKKFLNLEDQICMLCEVLEERIGQDVVFDMSSSKVNLQIMGNVKAAYIDADTLFASLNNRGYWLHKEDDYSSFVEAFTEQYKKFPETKNLIDSLKQEIFKTTDLINLTFDCGRAYKYAMFNVHKDDFETAMIKVIDWMMPYAEFSFYVEFCECSKLEIFDTEDLGWRKIGDVIDKIEVEKSVENAFFCIYKDVKYKVSNNE